MAVITPQSDVYLLKVPLEIDNNNQLTFANATAQFNYFNSLPKIGFDDFTYIRKDGVLRVPALFDEIINYNYVMYRNDAYSNKWFYAYITGMEYVNDNVTDVSIATDTWQCWQFDLQYKPTLIEREHVNDDTMGKHTIPENLETGEYVTNGTVENFGIEESGVSDYCIVVDVSMIENPGTNQTLTYSWTTGHSTPSQYVNGIPSGLYHIVLGYYSSAVIGARSLIDVYDKAGLGDAIQNVYILPKSLIGDVESGLTISTTGSAPVASVGGLCMPQFSTGVTSLGTFTHTTPTTLDGYTPKNRKLLCYPFNYMNVSNNAGTTVPYRYEDFTNNTVSFTVEGVMTPSGSTKAVPNNYKNIDTATENAYDYSINGAKYPICSWTTDSFTNWLTQNAVNQRVNAETTGLDVFKNIGLGFATGGAVGGVIGAVAGLASTFDTAQKLYAQESSANVVPDQSRGNVNSGDIVWSKMYSKFTFLPMSIKKEYAESLDHYFSAFGYRVNTVKVPNVTGRRNWNFVKTAKCYIEADIPQEDLQDIKSMFDRGITFWHNPATFADYSQNNDII